MEAARRIAGYALGGADILRRAMGKKKLKRWPNREFLSREPRKSNGIDEKKQ